jgi:hypothetical protein
MDVLSSTKMPENTQHQIHKIEPGSFKAYKHWYPKALNSTIHPMIQFFLHLDNQLIIDRYCHLHPVVKPGKLKEVLNYRPDYFPWSGADLINVTNIRGKKQMVVIENNSCPSGQKSMPLVSEQMEQGGYRQLIEKSFSPYCRMHKMPAGSVVAVLFDKNLMENSGYAAVMADYFQRPVYLVPFFDGEANEHLRIQNDYIEILIDGKYWKPVYAAFRYVTQKPWNRIPIHTKTKIYNPIVACLAGGRNKMMASKGYDILNEELKQTGLKIRTPETIRDVSKKEIPALVKQFGGQAVIKVPYSNAGQGVYTIVNKGELDAFMQEEFEYKRFIVQSLIGHYNWSSKSSSGKYYHLGTIPNAKGEAFVFDLRMMICATPAGFKPLSVYSRRAELPLISELQSGGHSWDILGTNLSHKLPSGEWTTDTHRLLLMDRRDFNTLGLGLDDLIEAYIQTVLSTIAIDKMAGRLINKKGGFRKKLFASLNDDSVLTHEIVNQ